jgi:hypothetical protein
MNFIKWSGASGNIWARNSTYWRPNAEVVYPDDMFGMLGGEYVRLGDFRKGQNIYSGAPEEWIHDGDERRAWVVIELATGKIVTRQESGAARLWNIHGRYVVGRNDTNGKLMVEDMISGTVLLRSGEGSSVVVIRDKIIVQMEWKSKVYGAKYDLIYEIAGRVIDATEPRVWVIQGEHNYKYFDPKTAKEIFAMEHGMVPIGWIGDHISIETRYGIHAYARVYEEVPAVTTFRQFHVGMDVVHDKKKEL